MYIPDQIIVAIHPLDNSIEVYDGAPERQDEKPLANRGVIVYADKGPTETTVQVTFAGSVTRTYGASQVEFTLASGKGEG